MFSTDKPRNSNFLLSPPTHKKIKKAMNVRDLKWTENLARFELDMEQAWAQARKLNNYLGLKLLKYPKHNFMSLILSEANMLIWKLWKASL